MGSCAIPLSIVNCDVSSRLKRSLIHGKKCVKLKWQPLTPLGIPVEPLVKETSHQGELNGGDLDAKVKLYRQEFMYGRADCACTLENDERPRLSNAKEVCPYV